MLYVAKQKIKCAYKRFLLRKKKVIFERKCQISLDSEFEGCNRIGQETNFAGHIGFASYIGDHCRITAKIGRYCSISPRVVTVRGSHPTSRWASTHPAFFSPKKQCGMTFVSETKYQEMKPIIQIGNDVWIGDSVLIMDGIVIGDGAIIAAGAVVTKNVEPYAIVGGVPAKLIRYRFEPETIRKLLELCWWNRPLGWIQKQAENFAEVEKLELI